MSHSRNGHWQKAKRLTADAIFLAGFTALAGACMSGGASVAATIETTATAESLSTSQGLCSAIESIPMLPGFESMFHIPPANRASPSLAVFAPAGQWTIVPLRSL